MDIRSYTPFFPTPSTDTSTQPSSADGDDSGDEVGAHKGGRRKAFRSLGVAAHDAWVSQNEGSVEGSEEPESTVTAAEGEQAANSDSDQSAGGQGGRDTRSSALLSQGRKKLLEQRFRAPSEADGEPLWHRLACLLDVVAESPPIRPGSPNGYRLQLVSRLESSAVELVKANMAGRILFMRPLLSQSEWDAVRANMGRPSLTEVGMALRSSKLEAAFGIGATRTPRLANALLPLKLLSSMAPPYLRKRGISDAITNIKLQKLFKLI